MSEYTPFIATNPGMVPRLRYAHHFLHGSIAPFADDRKRVLLLQSQLCLRLGDTRAVWQKVVNLSDAVRRRVGRFLLPEVANMLAVCREYRDSTQGRVLHPNRIASLPPPEVRGCDELAWPASRPTGATPDTAGRPENDQFLGIEEPETSFFVREQLPDACPRQIFVVSNSQIERKGPFCYSRMKFGVLLGRREKRNGGGQS